MTPDARTPAPIATPPTTSAPASLPGRRPLRSRPGQPLIGALALARARVHEFCGNARHRLAMQLAARMSGPVFWIAPGWSSAGPNPDAMVHFVDPARFVFVAPGRAEDLLWCMEEVLRSGAVPLVFADLPSPPALTPVRRLQLAAEAAEAKTETAPLGVLLTPGDGGAPGVESRWRMLAAHATARNGYEDIFAWRLTRLRARTAPVGDWSVAQTRSAAGKAGLKTVTAPGQDAVSTRRCAAGSATDPGSGACPAAPDRRQESASQSRG